MSDASFWPVSAEEWSTLIANSIAITTFFLGRRAFLSYLVKVRRALESARFSDPGDAAPPDVLLPHVNIEIDRPTPGNRWLVHWTEPGGQAGPDGNWELSHGEAVITSFRLRWHLRWNKRTRNLPVVGEIRFLKANSGPRMVEISAIDHITRGGIPGWIARVLFG